MSDTRRLFADVATAGPDPRQQLFRESVATMVQHFQTPGAPPIEVPALEGYPASHVDLGWIQDQVCAFVKRAPVSFEEIATLIELELPLVVQRAKDVRIGNIGWPDVLEIAFETKDDASTYFYRLFVPLVE